MRFIIASDLHGQHADSRAAQAVLACIKDFKPQIRVFAGDLWDFAAIRRGASEDERALSMRDDFDAGREFAGKFFKGGTSNHLLLGNHDIRPHMLRESPDAVRRDLGERMVKDIAKTAYENKARIYDYDARLGVLKLGHLCVVHGFHTGVSSAAQHARVYGNVVYGHTHSIDVYQTPGLEQREARGIGCLCSLDMDYASSKTGKLRWAHGWAVGDTYADGSYTIFQVRSIDGRFCYPTEFRHY